MRIKTEWIVIAVLVLYILYISREHMVGTGSDPTPKTVTTCPAGYAYDAVSKTCAPVNQGQGTGPVPSGSGTTTSPAPAISTGPVTNTAPITTPTPTMPPVTPPPSSSVVPAMTSSSTPARH